MKKSSFAKSVLFPDQVSEFYKAKITGTARKKIFFVSKGSSSVFQMKLNEPIALLAFDILHSMSGVLTSMKSMIDPK